MAVTATSHPLDFYSTTILYTNDTNSSSSVSPSNTISRIPGYCFVDTFPTSGGDTPLHYQLQHQQHLNVTFDFVVNGLGITIVAMLGIIGNILSAVVLSRPQMRSSVTCLLLGLAFCDSLLIVISTLIFGLPAMSDFTGTLKTYRHVFYPLWVPYFYPISTTAQTGSVYLTLAVTIERYVAVCHPLRARSLCTWRRARYCVGTVFTLAILYNLPRWFEVCTCMKGFHLDLNETIYDNEMCPMRENPLYISIYVNWTYLIVMYLVPFSGLVVFNWAIYRQVRKANRERQVLSKLQRREMGLATMLLFVVVVFLLCNILPLVNNILESFYDTGVDQLVQASNFLVVLNSSVNFVIYCTCGERFRRLLFRLCRDFLVCRLGHRDSLRSSVYRKSNFYRGQHGGEFEEVTSVANTHTCITTAGNANGILLVDISGEKPNRRLSNYRNKTIPSSTRHHAHHNHTASQNGNGKVHGHGPSGHMSNGNGKVHVNRRISSPPPS